ncbi:hypothetical protein A9179_06345 [Pseudomonas alcaligenes]|uniref:Cysteine-rich CWC n=1 Tax=Aquipseudomonas alcaligenes TaxID=43263 RepID=A0ABR7RYR4_AQUAC|nr:cysteine-rich CWC family protein [Pseudomonas alcaligenes]MBC9249892.1 hypothetical protein [Pseudomonas alcaligenes]
MSDATRCPRCGQLNHCAQAGQDAPVQDCWCFHTPLAPGALDELPAEWREQSCLCPNCLRALAEHGQPE